MASKITIKTKDICEALGVGKHQLRAWTDSLSPFSVRETKERSANQYDPGDLMFFAVVQRLTDEFGLSLPFISKCSQQLYGCIREPQSLTYQPYIFINIESNSCSWIGLNNMQGEGIVFSVQPAQELVFQYLGFSTNQFQMHLGLMEVK